MFILTDQNSIGSNFLAELRSESVQKDSMRFRRNLERTGELLAYEISKTLDYTEKVIKTPLGESGKNVLARDIVLAPVLRAGIPFFNGFLNYFDSAESAFIASYRQVVNDEGMFEIKGEYTVAPHLDGKALILIDPMLATGQSLLMGWKSLLEYGRPAHTYVASVVASREGVNFLNENMQDFSLWLGDVDEKLNSKAYIVPGLGDAGDLAFGEKI